MGILDVPWVPSLEEGVQDFHLKLCLLISSNNITHIGFWYWFLGYIRFDCADSKQQLLYRENSRKKRRRTLAIKHNLENYLFSLSE